MWILTLRAPDSKPADYTLRDGLISIGRRRDNNIVIPDEAASRRHAELRLDQKANALTIRDLGSKNGTFINRRRLTGNRDFKLEPNDIIRIGLVEIQATYKPDEAGDDLVTSAFQPFNRELLLESFDNHAVLLYEIIQHLNSILDIDVALEEVASLLRVTLGADKCQIILAEDFDRMPELGFPETIGKYALKNNTTVLLPGKGPESRQLLSQSARLLRVYTALCVPVAASDKTIALIYMYRTSSDMGVFSQRDLQLALAVGHLAALTIERVSLMDRVKEEQRLRQLLQRFVAPGEAEFLLRNYVDTGSLPALTEMTCTILFADIAGSFGMAERLGAKAFGALLEHYYQDVTDIIFQFGGLLDKYLGDGVMAVFGMTGRRKNPEQRAVSAALEILDLLSARYRKTDRLINIGIGINTGPVVAGYVSTRERVELSVLGDTVNVAAGLESLARPNRVLIGPATQAAVAGKFKLASLGDLSIKERSKPIPVYEVLSEGNSHPAVSSEQLANDS